MKKKMQNTYETRDFYTSCLLKTLDFKLLELVRGNNNFVTFVFDDSENKASETISKYWNREIVCNAYDLIQTINELKTRIYTR